VIAAWLRRAVLPLPGDFGVHTFTLVGRSLRCDLCGHECEVESKEAFQRVLLRCDECQANHVSLGAALEFGLFSRRMACWNGGLFAFNGSLFLIDLWGGQWIGLLSLMCAVWMWHATKREWAAWAQVRPLYHRIQGAR
jgi:hypothetical protein